MAVGATIPIFFTHAPRVAALVLVAYLTWPILSKDAPLFHWHPFLMTLSFAVLLPGGLSYLQPRLSLFQFMGLRMGHTTKVSIISNMLWVSIILVSLSVFPLTCIPGAFSLGFHGPGGSSWILRCGSHLLQ